MTTETNTTTDPKDPVTTPDGGGQPTPTVAELMAEMKALQNDVAKYRNIARTAQTERDTLKKTTKKPDSEPTDEYKQQLTEANDKLTKYELRVKSSAIKEAALDKLLEIGVPKERFTAALKLLDQNLIEWDDENGVDNSSVATAIQKLKREHPWLPEVKTKSVDIKNPADGASDDAKTISRTEFDRLSPTARADKMKQGYLIKSS